MRQVPHRLQQDSVTQQAQVRENVAMPSGVRRPRTAFTIHHNLLPAVDVRALDRDHILLRGPLPKPDARQAPVSPVFDITLHMLPPY